ncbi:MAG: hypothetical protein M0Q37_09800, partial [Sphaerochaeta sp.]|nr:hypothetical protein [Sphaerochaeta sp.]
MRAEIPYADGRTFTLTLADEHLVGVYEPNDIPKEDEQTMFDHALGGLDAFLVGCTSLLLIINDAT